MDRFIYRSGDTLTSEVLISQFSQSDIEGDIVKWSIVDHKGMELYSGTIATDLIATGGLHSVGHITQVVESSEAQQCQLKIELGEYVNRWNIWIYPQLTIESGDILIAQNIDDKVISQLSSGGSVLLTPRKGSIKNEGANSVAVGFSTIFWNTLWTNGQAPHTMGILCDPNSPALQHFPTSYHSDYQWWDAMSHSSAIPMSSLNSQIEPIVRIIDDWFTARSLGLIVEMKVGRGKLLLSGIDLLEDSENRLEAQQLTYSLLQYMQGNEFNPKYSVELDNLVEIL